MKRYCCGFMLNDEKTKVVLIKKTHPEWQAGLLNGVGGHIEEGESAITAMVREFWEETGVATHFDSWSQVCTLYFPYAEIEFFVASNSYYAKKVQSMTDEQVSIIDVTDLNGTIDNIPALLELSIQRIIDREVVTPRKAAHNP